ncbi:hypothetical protein L9F63_007355, partial [Diploptera punctata]
ISIYEQATVELSIYNLKYMNIKNVVQSEERCLLLNFRFISSSKKNRAFAIKTIQDRMITFTSKIL